MEQPTFKLRKELYSYDAIPIMFSAESLDGRLWGGMTLGDDIEPGVQCCAVLFLLDSADFGTFEAGRPTKDLLTGDYLRNLMQAATECWLVSVFDIGHAILTLRQETMREDWLPTKEGDDI